METGEGNGPLQLSWSPLTHSKQVSVFVHPTLSIRLYLLLCLSGSDWSTWSVSAQVTERKGWKNNCSKCRKLLFMQLSLLQFLLTLYNDYIIYSRRNVPKCLESWRHARLRWMFIVLVRKFVLCIWPIHQPIRSFGCPQCSTRGPNCRCAARHHGQQHLAGGLTFFVWWGNRSTREWTYANHKTNTKYTNLQIYFYSKACYVPLIDATTVISTLWLR